MLPWEAAVGDLPVVETGIFQVGKITNRGKLSNLAQTAQVSRCNGLAGGFSNCPKLFEMSSSANHMKKGAT